MDNQDSEERERSEPCSARANPFTDDEGTTSRKRQKITSASLQSRMVDVSNDTISQNDLTPTPPPIPQNMGDKAESPKTPPHVAPRSPAEPTSSRVTINLRTDRNLETPYLSHPSPSAVAQDGSQEDARISVESESDALSTVPAIETPSASPSELGSPEIELITMVDEDGDYETSDPPMAIIGGADGDIYVDPMASLPYKEPDESYVDALMKVENFLLQENITDAECFCLFRDWFAKALAYASDHATMFEMFERNRLPWLRIPNLIASLNRRSRFFGPFLSQSRQSRSALTDMIVQFARLAGRFLAMDVRILEEHAKTGNPEQPPVLASPRYLPLYEFLFQKEANSHIGHNLELHYSWRWDDDMVQFSDSFQSEGGTLQNLIRWVGLQSPFLELDTKIIERLIYPCRIAARMVPEAKRFVDYPNLHFSSQIEPPRSTLSQSYDFFRTVNTMLEVIIEKYLTNITPDAMLTYVNSLNTVYRCALEHNPTGRATLDEFVARHPDIPRRLTNKAISLEWKFSILKKLLMSAQMQLRVTGVTTMCTDLVSAFQADKGNDAATSPLLLFFADFILENQFIDYIVGIGSHPEIINESSNIVGFLIVTKTYTTKHTDKIWQTVMNSQDPRVVEAILRMITRLLTFFEYQPLLYLCDKVSEVHLTAFTPAMREFCHKLFADILAKASPDTIHMMTPAYDLCVRLLRESSVATSDSPMGNPDMHKFARCRLVELLRCGPSPDGRLDIYMNCFGDITSKSPTSAGSLCVIQILLRHYTQNDLEFLTTQRGLTRFLIEEMESTAATELQKPTGYRFHQANDARRELLQMIIVNEPGTISPELGERLWNILVGSDSGLVLDRLTSWEILNKAAESTSANNEFLISCFQEYFPNLPPHCFTGGALVFAKKALDLWQEESRANIDEDDWKFESPALNQLWRIILTAPRYTIDAAAIEHLVKVYLTDSLIKTVPKAKARTIHLSLVERCLSQLKRAASNLKDYSDGTTSGSEESMVIVASEDQFQEQEKIFARSLAVLREFLSAHKTIPEYAEPTARPLVATAPGSIEGDPFTLKYQSFDGNKHSEIKRLDLGKRNTTESLFATLQHDTGFDVCNIYCNGQLLNRGDVDLCKSLDAIDLNGLVLIWRVPETASSANNPDNRQRSLETEIVKHFDDLWGYLSMHEKVAREIYTFLVTFPVYDRLLEGLKSEETPYSELFPSTQPYKSLYAIHVLRESMIGTSINGAANDELLTRAISLIVAALSDPAVFANCTTEDMKKDLTLNFVDCLIKFLSEGVPPVSVSSLLDESLLHHLLLFLSNATDATSSQGSSRLACRLFECMLVTSQNSLEFWVAFQSHLKNKSLLRQLLLEDPRSGIRKKIASLIMGRCVKDTPSLAKVSSNDFATTFWHFVSGLIGDAVRNPEHGEDVLALSNTLFRKLGENPIRLQSLDGLVQQWGTLLLSYRSSEVIGQLDSIDLVAHGLANLVLAASKFLKAAQQELFCRDIGVALFQEHLFPEPSDENNCSVISPRIPLLNTLTRQTLYEAVFNLVKDSKPHWRQIMHNLAQLVPYDPQVDPPYAYDLPYLFERHRSVRSQTGYVGLKNLSNTCYLNSLFTQLFMNVPFRNFMLNSHVTDCGTSQKLLSETQKLFSFMQNSIRRFIDPTNLASSIETYDNTGIDVNIQMDVDEFYNLLFDRWEGQMLSEDAKRTFKSFYGGQLVQQVKSKECEHISEREESFSAIQCDIKGKNSLEESLQAYVEGEVMEGDNKYKCSSCDRHVDAVKRACLKQIPDNLIFHLKRFDFNLRTLQRSKINDYFTFPSSIDMRPYKVEYLTDASHNTSEDIFELVGILVHSGTAESGHYYSFIRERPSRGNTDSWVEYNDEQVSSWDPSMMEASCFGGIDPRTMNAGDIQYDKPWSAYMLFYQRKTSLNEQQQALEVSNIASPIRLDIQSDLGIHIALENEILLRKYCLYDPSHMEFVAKMCRHVQRFNGGQCSMRHGLEQFALGIILNHIDQVVARSKDIPEFKAVMDMIEESCARCPHCSTSYLEWFYHNPDGARNLLLRNPDTEVRSRVSDSIVIALRKVKSDLPAAYSSGEDSDEDSSDEDNDKRDVLVKFAKTMNKMWEVFHTNTRGWPEYFGLLVKIAELGELETALLLDYEFLYRCLNIVCADLHLAPDTQYVRMLNVISKRMATRPVSYDAVVALLSQLLRACDLSIDIAAADHILQSNSRLQLAINKMSIPISYQEFQMLTHKWTKNEVNIFTEKLFFHSQNEDATRSIISLLLGSTLLPDLTIRQAIICNIKTSNLHAAPFVRAALWYCEHTCNGKGIPIMIHHVAKVAYHVENAEGKEFLDFFKDVVQIPSFRSRINREDVLRVVLDNVNYWGPGLLTYYEAGVRLDTETLLQQIILGPDALDRFAEETEDRDAIILQAAQKLGISCLEFIHDIYIRQRLQAVRSIMQSIQDTIEACAGLFEENDENENTRQFKSLRQEVLPALRRFIVEEADEETSGWDNSDGEGYSSDPLDSHINDDEIPL